MDFNILGPLEIVNEGTSLVPRAPKVKQLLALFLLRSNKILSLDSIIEELWEDRPPRSAVTTAQTYIYQLRKAFSLWFGEDRAERLLVTAAPGYVLSVPATKLDANRFDALVRDGRAALARDEPRAARVLVDQALALRSGPPLSNVAAGPLLRNYIGHIEEKQIAALELRVFIDMKLERHREAIVDLRSLVYAHPFNEWFHTQLVRSLTRVGRRGEALQAYQNLRVLLREELGLDPSTELQRLHSEILSTEPRGADALRYTAS